MERTPSFLGGCMEEVSFTNEPDGFIRGDKSRYNPSYIIYNGLKGTMRYWRSVTELSPYGLRERVERYLAGKLTIEQVVQPKNEEMAQYAKLARRKPRRIVTEPKTLPSGIPEVRSLL